MNELEREISERVKNNGFMTYNHMELERMDPDHAVFRLDIRPESRNVYGMVHGGALYTLADNAAGCAVHTDGRNYVTQSGSMNFLRNQGAGTVRAEARVRHRGGSTALVMVDIFGEQDTLLATGEYSFFCVDRKRVEEQARKEQEEL